MYIKIELVYKKGLYRQQDKCRERHVQAAINAPHPPGQYPPRGDIVREDVVRGDVVRGDIVRGDFVRGGYCPRTE